MSRRMVGKYHKVESKIDYLDISLQGYLTILGEDEYNGGYMQFGSQEKDTPELVVSLGDKRTSVTLKRWKTQICSNVNAVKIRKSSGGLDKLFSRLNCQFREFASGFEKEVLMLKEESIGCLIQFAAYQKPGFGYCILAKEKQSDHFDDYHIPDLAIVDCDGWHNMKLDFVKVDANLDQSSGEYTTKNGEAILYNQYGYIPLDNIGCSEVSFIDISKTFSGLLSVL